MNYNENFVRWITYLIFGMLCISVAFLSIAAGLIINVIQNVDWTSTQTMLLIASGICILLGLTSLGISSLAKMKWEYESKNKPEE